MGELYRKLHGSETGLGDLILKAYDATSSELAARRAELRELRSERAAQGSDAVHALGPGWRQAVALFAARQSGGDGLLGHLVRSLPRSSIRFTNR